MHRTALLVGRGQHVGDRAFTPDLPGQLGSDGDAIDSLM
jgi:hypothetical protein